MSKDVTTSTIVDGLQGLIEEASKDTKLTTKERADIIIKATGRQLQAGALSLGYMKLRSRIPIESTNTPALVLNSLDDKATT